MTKYINEVDEGGIILSHKEPEVITTTFNCEHSPANLLTCHNQITSLRNPVHLYICVNRNNKLAWKLIIGS